MHDIAWHMLHSISDKKYEVFRFLVTVVFYECCLRLIFPLNVFWENVGLGEERMRKRGAGWRGGWTFLAVKTQMKERITGSHFLCERDRERERKSKIMHERGKVRVKEKPVNHLKDSEVDTFTSTSSHSIFPVSVSHSESPCFLVTCYLILLFLWEKMPFFDSPTVKALIDKVGKLIKRSFNFWHEKVRLTWHIQIPLCLRSPFFKFFRWSFQHYNMAQMRTQYF